MIYGEYYCNNCRKYLIALPPQERCHCGNLEIKKIKEIYENQVDREIERLECEGERVL